jgi:hypothetical protein
MAEMQDVFTSIGMFTQLATEIELCVHGIVWSLKGITSRT